MQCFSVSFGQTKNKPPHSIMQNLSISDFLLESVAKGLKYGTPSLPILFVTICQVF